MAAASDIGESDPGSGCDVIGVSIPPIVGVSTFWGDAVVGNDSSRLKRRSRLLVSGLFVAIGLGAFFGLSSSDDELEDSDSDSELLSSLLSSVSDFSFFFFFAASDPGFGAGLAFVSAFLASTETSGSRSDLTDFEGSTFFGTSSSSSDPELDPEPELLLLLLLQQRKQNDAVKESLKRFFYERTLLDIICL